MDIKKIRKREGLTQAELAEKLGVAAYTIRRWEQHINSPSPIARKLLKEIFREDKG